MQTASSPKVLYYGRNSQDNPRLCAAKLNIWLRPTHCYILSLWNTNQIKRWNITAISGLYPFCSYLLVLIKKTKKQMHPRNLVGDYLLQPPKPFPIRRNVTSSTPWQTLIFEAGIYQHELRNCTCSLRISLIRTKFQ